MMIPSATCESSRRLNRELRAFEKVWLEPGESKTLALELDDRAFGYWDPADSGYQALLDRPGTVAAVVPAGGGAAKRQEPGWYIDAGRSRLHIDRSSAETAHVSDVTVQKEAGPPAP